MQMAMKIVEMRIMSRGWPSSPQGLVAWEQRAYASNQLRLPQGTASLALMLIRRASVLWANQKRDVPSSCPAPSAAGGERPRPALLRGEGWGEGLYPRVQSQRQASCHAPPPKIELHSNFDLSPQKGGER